MDGDAVPAGMVLSQTMLPGCGWRMAPSLTKERRVEHPVAAAVRGPWGNSHGRAAGQKGPTVKTPRVERRKARPPDRKGGLRVSQEHAP